MADYKTNPALPVANQFVEDAFGIPNAVALECSVLPLSDGSAIIQYRGASISTADFAGVPAGVIFDIAQGTAYVKDFGGSWAALQYAGT
jgi:hypothetical protein